MEIQVQYLKMKSSEAMTQLLTRKLESLEKKYDWLIRARVVFKIENDSKGEDKVCEIELYAPGPSLFASSSSEDFEKSMAESVDDLKRQLEKRQASFGPRGLKV